MNTVQQKIYLCCKALSSIFSIFFFFNDTATTEIYTLSLHDALPIFEMVNLLIKNKADINVKNKWGVVPLHDACYFGKIEIGRAHV